MGGRSWVIPLKMPDSQPNGNRPNAVLKINGAVMDERRAGRGLRPGRPLVIVRSGGMSHKPRLRLSLWILVMRPWRPHACTVVSVIPKRLATEVDPIAGTRDSRN